MKRFLRTHVWLVIAAVFTTADLCLNFAFGPTSSYIGLLVLVPILVSFDLDWRGVAVVSVALMVVAGTNLFGYDSGAAHIVIVRTAGVAVAGALGLFASVYRIRREASLTQSRAVAAAAQRAILPLVPTSLGRYAVASHYRSASQEASIGGDFFKVLATRFGVRVIIGDVQGKGLEAVNMAAIMLGCFREWAPEITSMKELVRILDARVGTQGGVEGFVTAVLATLGDELTVELVNCGHPWPVLYRDGVARPLVPGHSTTPLGLSPDPELQCVRLGPADRILLYTDGLVDIRDEAGRWVELDEVLEGGGAGSLSSVLPAMVDRLTARAGPPRDDLALLLMAVPESAAPPDSDRGDGAA